MYGSLFVTNITHVRETYKKQSRKRASKRSLISLKVWEKCSGSSVPEVRFEDCGVGQVYLGQLAYLLHSIYQKEGWYSSA